MLNKPTFGLKKYVIVINQKRSASVLNLTRDRVSKESTLVSKVREDQILFDKISHQFLVTTKQSKHPFSNSIGEQHQTLWLHV
jgi:hypothetical protein